MSGCPPLLLQFVRHVPSSKTCKLVIFSKRCSLQHRVLPLPHSLRCCLATVVTCSSQSGKMTFLSPSAMTFLHVENTAACGHYSTPLTYCKRLPQAPRPDPGSLVALWLTTTERSLIWTEQPEVLRWAQHLLSGWAPAVGPLLGTGHPPVPGPLLCHKDGTTAPSHHLSLLLPLQVICKEMAESRGWTMLRPKLLLRENSLTAFPILPSSASRNTSDLSIFLVSGHCEIFSFWNPISCSLFPTLLAQACQYSPCVGTVGR